MSRVWPLATSAGEAADFRRAWLGVAAAFFVSGAAFGSWTTRIPSVKVGLDLRPGSLGLALLGPAVGALSTMPLAGHWVARVGSRRMTQIGLIAFCAALPLPVLAPSFVALCASLLILGAANGLLDVAMNAEGVAVEERFGKPILSGLHGIFSVGGMAGAASGGLLIAAGLPAVVHLALVGAVLLLGGLAMSRGLVEASSVKAAPGPTFLWPSRRLMLLGLVALGVLFAEGSAADWSAVYLRDAVGTGPGVAASGYAAFSLAMATGRFCGDRLAARVGPAALVRAGGLLGALGLGAGLWAHHPVASVVGFGFMGLGLSCIIPVVFRVAGAGPASGPSIAAVATMGYLGFLAGPPLIGAAAQLVGLSAALGLVVILLAAIVILAGFLREPSRAAASAHDAAGHECQTHSPGEEAHDRSRH